MGKSGSSKDAVLLLVGLERQDKDLFIPPEDWGFTSQCKDTVCVLSIRGGIAGACAAILSSGVEVLGKHGQLVGSVLGHPWLDGNLKSWILTAWQVIPSVVLWSVWKLRNDCLFKGVVPDFVGLCERMKMQVALWVKWSLKLIIQSMIFCLTSTGLGCMFEVSSAFGSGSREFCLK